MLQLKVVNSHGNILSSGTAGERVSLLYEGEYHGGDRILLECSQPTHCVVCFEDTLTPALVYVKDPVCSYRIPFDEGRVVFSPRSFTSTRHLITARIAAPEEIALRRNLALNPFDQHGDNGFFPHTSANVETRGESVFASYNAVDGVYENISHGPWPYQSWGINRDPKAEWALSFGRSVLLDELRVTLRADFPHDSHWVSGTVVFSDGSTEVLHFQKTAFPQPFAIAPRRVEWLVLKDLIKADDESPFPALTQFEAWGNEVG